MNALTVMILIGVLVFLWCLHFRNNMEKTIALYKLKTVWDDLIFLVADGKLDKNGEVFQYYNRQIIQILQLDSNTGLDDAMAAFLLLRKNKGFDRSLTEAVQQAEEMLELVEKESIDVSEVIADYYAASKNVMLVHSSVLRLLYLVVVKYRLPKLANRLIPDAIRAGIKTVKFADTEEARFRQVTHQARTA